MTSKSAYFFLVKKGENKILLSKYMCRCTYFFFLGDYLADEKTRMDYENAVNVIKPYELLDGHEHIKVHMDSDAHSKASVVCFAIILMIMRHK